MNIPFSAIETKAGKWVDVKHSFKTESSQHGLVFLTFANTGFKKIWIDAVKLEEQ